jgi:hypothetical protein
MQVHRDPDDTPATPKLPETGAVPGLKYDLKQTAALIKKRLTQLYPSVKFSVRGEWFSMGNAIRVAWTDGPTEKPVQAFIDQFKSGSFNSMEDIYEYKRDSQFDGKYISTSRNVSATYCAQGCYELDLCQPPTVEAQLHALGKQLLKGYNYQPGRSYGVKAENGHFLFTAGPVGLVERYTDERLRRALEAQGYQVEAGIEEGEYVLAAYKKQA